MKVYLVFDNYDSSPYGVFSTEEKAKKFISDLTSKLETKFKVKLGPDSHWIDVQDLDPTLG